MEKKTAWITGASSGIGEALVYEMNKKGVVTIISARRKAELERVKNNCIDTGLVHIMPLDVKETDSFPRKSKKGF